MPLSQSFKIKELLNEIELKVADRNRETGRAFYSENPLDYRYEDTIEYKTYKLMLFVCPKSKSTISIKIIE